VEGSRLTGLTRYSQLTLSLRVGLYYQLNGLWLCAASYVPSCILTSRGACSTDNFRFQMDRDIKDATPSHSQTFPSRTTWIHTPSPLLMALQPQPQLVQYVQLPFFQAFTLLVRIPPIPYRGRSKTSAPRPLPRSSLMANCLNPSPIGLPQSIGVSAPLPHRRKLRLS